MSLIEVKSLSKSYGRVQAVKELNFSVGGGEFVGLVGPNGAGKTTTIKMLAGQLLPSKGTVSIAGTGLDDPNGLRANLGYVPEFPRLYEYLTGREMIEFVAEIRGGVMSPGRWSSPGSGRTPSARSRSTRRA